MANVVKAAEAIRRGEKIVIDDVLSVLRQATAKRQSRALLESVEGPSVVVGPIRGHASDFASYLLTTILPNPSSRCIVFLGNYIDGAHQSVEVLYLIALLVLDPDRRVVPLMGKHELLYPIHPENFGSLQNELRLRALHTGVKVEQYEALFKQFFFTLSIACVIDKKYFCVAGGPASAYRYLSQIQSAESHEHLREFVVNEQMDEDEERLAEGSAFVASPNEDAFRFTFNAACNFVSRNNLATLIVGMEYHTSRPDYDSFARPNHYKESIYFPGFIFGRIHPQTQIPAVVTIFSAPSFCAVNRNSACVLEVANNRLEVHEFKADPKRPLIMPGPQDHAFSWAQPMLERATTACAREIIFGTIVEEADATEDPEYKRQEAIATAKMRRMCQLLQMHNLPLPDLPVEEKELDIGTYGSNAPHP